MSGSNSQPKQGGTTNIGGNVNTDKNVNVGNGATGSFTSADGKQIQVQDGIIINIT